MAKERPPFERPYDPAKPLRRKDVERAVLAIWAEHSHRLTSTFHAGPYKPTKNESAKDFLRREIYALGAHLLRWPSAGSVVDDLVDKIRIARTRPDKRDDVFHALLMCMYDDDSAISRQERWLMAKELEYAHRHRIPPELVCGFLYQSGPRTEMPKKIKAGHVEPAFRDQLSETD